MAKKKPVKINPAQPIWAPRSVAEDYFRELNIPEDEIPNLIKLCPPGMSAERMREIAAEWCDANGIFVTSADRPAVRPEILTEVLTRLKTRPPSRLETDLLKWCDKRGKGEPRNDGVGSEKAFSVNQKDNLQTDVDQNAMLSAGDLASRFGVDPEAVRKRLDRWRKGTHDGWSEVTDRKPREPKYLFRFSAVSAILKEMASGETSSERPAK
jgi:hypothetical protein